MVKIKLVIKNLPLLFNPVFKPIIETIKNTTTGFIAIVVLGCILFVGFYPLKFAYIFISTANIGSNEAVYPVLIVGGKNKALPAIKYKIYPEIQTVVRYDADDGAPKKYSNCSVADENNWRCEGKSQYFQMVKGNYTESQSDNNLKFVSHFKWCLVKTK